LANCPNLLEECENEFARKVIPRKCGEFTTDSGKFHRGRSGNQNSGHLGDTKIFSVISLLVISLELNNTGPPHPTILPLKIISKTISTFQINSQLN